MNMNPDLYLVSVPSLAVSLKATEYAPQPVPSLREFEQLWLAWDVVSTYMIPVEELLSKPINLRNCCIFYLGHIPAFLDIHLTRVTGDAPTTPSHYQKMFERGIDPDVENPENCHAHSEIPDEWPPLKEILAYQGRVRDRARALYKDADFGKDRKIGRALWIGFEHEGTLQVLFSATHRKEANVPTAVMHLETLLYMLLQRDKSVPRPGERPDFEALAVQAQKNAVPNQWFEVPASRIAFGMMDPENDKGPDRYFGWDNEKPKRHVDVEAFEAKARPITNEDYAKFLDQTHKEKVPASWATCKDISPLYHAKGGTMANGNGAYMNGLTPPLTDSFLSGKSVRTVYGAVPLKHALDWPVFASYEELASCAAWMGGRIPTAEEVRAIYNYVDVKKAKDEDSILTRKISAVNGCVQNSILCSTLANSQQTSLQ